VEPSNGSVRQIVNICLLFTFSALCAAIVFITWTIIYGNENIRVPPHSNTIPPYIANRSRILSKYYANIDNNFSIPQPAFVPAPSADDDEPVVQSPSKWGSFIYSKSAAATTGTSNNDSSFRLVCYFNHDSYALKVTEISPRLCTHINVGIFDVVNNSLVLTETLRATLTDIQALKLQNPELKILLWVGAAFTGHFSEMVHTHANRKIFIKSVKNVLEEFRVDGIDLDWEFPNGMTKERIHFAQLLHEIRREYQREHRTYLLSLAVAAPSILVDLTYDVREINDNVDFVNIMSYDFHFHSPQTPWTGLNAPLYKRHNEASVWAMMNINYSVNYWEQRGLERSKIVIGLPTYAHTFKLVNPFNTKIGSPTENYGRVGQLGFASYSDVCWFQQNNIFVTVVYDIETCSPYMHAGTEWISFENEQSLECKVKFVKNNKYGGAMMFSLNTDDHQSTCRAYLSADNTKKFPLVEKVNSILFS